jgi:membrane protease YdiL (CAAX protease family)
MAIALRDRRAREQAEETDIADIEAEVRDWLREVTGNPGADPEPKPDPRPATPPPVRRDERAGSRATKTIIKIIVANLAVQIGMVAVGRANHWDATTAMRVSLFSAAVFYGIVACVVGMRSDDLGVRPRWLIGPAPTAIAIGAAVGGAIAIALTAILTLAAGTPQVDPSAGLLAGSQNLALILGGALVVAAVAPLVEELVFRGFLTEALRHRGRWSALVLGGLAFSIAHLRFAQLRYYLIMGIGFGALYWSRGLVASIAAHASFNGLLIVFAIASVHGPAQTFIASNIHVSLPATWHKISATGDIDLGVIGPANAQIGVSHVDWPAGANVTADRLDAALRSGRLPLPGDLQIDAASVHVLSTKLGPAVRATATIKRHAETAVFVPLARRMVIFEIAANGSGRAMRDFDAMVSAATSS